MREDAVHAIWEEEDDCIEDFNEEKWESGLKIISNPRSIHFLLLPAQEGLNE